MKTVEILPDGNANTVYTNEAGQVMLSVRQQLGSADDGLGHPRQRRLVDRQRQAGAGLAVGRAGEGRPGPQCRGRGEEPHLVTGAVAVQDLL